MRFEKVIRGSAYGTIGYLVAPHDLEVLERTVVHNLPVLELFAQVIVATNYGAETGGAARAELAAANRELWQRHFPGCVVLDSPHNRGHSIGTADLDNLLFDHCKTAGIEWLCKSANDVLLSAPVLDIEVETADFYYLNAISYAAMEQQGFDLARIGAELFYPQTNFYVIHVSKTDYLVDKELLDRSWAIVNRTAGYDGRIWEHIPRWSCELLLRTCVLRNRLTRHHLMDEAQFAELLTMIRDHAVEDCSLKNVTINGICHAHDRPKVDA